MATATTTTWPINDSDFEDVTIASVQHEGDGWGVKRSDGWSFHVPNASPVEPRVGMSARFYGKGIGHTVRGLFLDGEKVFYRTEDEEREFREIENYGADAAEWLKRWDDGRSVWSISMGGLGPGYEQCIQIIVAEVLRWLLATKPDLERAKTDAPYAKQIMTTRDDAVMKVPAVEKLGCSGAQWGAACNLAGFIYRDGPRKVMTDERVKDRHIQVCRVFPQ